MITRSGSSKRVKTQANALCDLPIAKRSKRGGNVKSITATNKSNASTSKKDQIVTKADHDALMKKLEKHVSVAKKVVLDNFERLVVKKDDYPSSTQTIWELLDGTDFQQDEDIIAGALEKSLNPKKLQGFSCLQSNSAIVSKVCKNVRSVEMIKFVWEELNDRMRSQQDVLMSVIACVRSESMVTFVLKEVIGQQKLSVQAALAASLIRGVPNKELARIAWNELDTDNLRSVPEVVFAILARSGAVLASKLPKSVVDNIDIMLDAVRQKKCLWKHLPSKLKKNVAFALAISPGDRPDFSDVEKHVTDKEQLWIGWAKDSPTKLSKIWRHMPVVLRSRRDLMLQAISQEPTAMEHVGIFLAEDIEFVRSALDRNLLALAYLPRQTLVRFPDVMSIESVETFKRTPDSSSHEQSLTEKLQQSHWCDRDFVLRWLALGYGVSTAEPFLAKELCDDEDVFLTAAKASIHRNTSTPGNLRALYRKMSDRLVNDRAFLRLLLASGGEPYVIFFDRSIIDHDLLMLALAKAPEKWLHWVPWSMKAGFKSTVYSQQTAYASFLKGFLSGTRCGSGSPLEMLDQGSDSSIKRHVAEYLDDFPIGEQLSELLVVHQRFLKKELWC